MSMRASACIAIFARALYTCRRVWKHIHTVRCVYFEWFSAKRNHIVVEQQYECLPNLIKTKRCCLYPTRYYREEHLLLPEASLIYLNLCIGCTCIYYTHLIRFVVCHLKIAVNRLLTTTLAN